MDRADQAKLASRTLYQTSGTDKVRMVRLQKPEILAPPCGYLIQVGDPIAVNGDRVYPKIVRGLLWELRTARFIDSKEAVMWAVFNSEEVTSYVGIGVMTNNLECAKEALEQELVVVEFQNG